MGSLSHKSREEDDAMNAAGMCTTAMAMATHMIGIHTMATLVPATHMKAVAASQIGASPGCYPAVNGKLASWRLKPQNDSDFLSLHRRYEPERRGYDRYGRAGGPDRDYGRYGSGGSRAAPYERSGLNGRAP